MSNKKLNWWSRYGGFDSGEGIYPHMGQVISSYRLKRGFRTQQDLATALGVSKRTVEELEGTINLSTPDSIERRQVIARLLRIPPALLALDWRFMVYDHSDINETNTFTDITQLLEDDTFTLYQNILRMGRGYLYNGGPSYIADIVDESLNKLLPITQNMPDMEREAWEELLCRYYQREVDEDDTFLRLNATALHHEKAKTLLRFGRLREAHSELITARKTLEADLLTWHINLFLTEANIYMAQKDLESSAASAIEAYKMAKVVQSPKDEVEVKKLFLALKSLDPANPYVCNLGLTIGMY